MTLLDVEIQAARRGYRLRRVEDGTHGGLWQWRREADGIGPMFLTERASFEWMNQQLTVIGDGGVEPPRGVEFRLPPDGGTAAAPDPGSGSA
jgi:hypothetical protein